MTNIILITVDCFRYDRAGFNGHHRPTTPTLDEISSESYIYDNAFATGPWTPESFPGIMAGLHSYNSAYFDNPNLKAIPQNQATIASALSDEGYETFASISNPHLTRRRGFDKGFENFTNLRISEQGEKFNHDNNENSDVLSKFDLGDLLWGLRSNLRSKEKLTMLNPLVLAFTAYRYYQSVTDWPIISAETVIDEFISDIQSASTPFFGWTHLMDLHTPIHPESVRKGGLASHISKISHFVTDARRVGNIYDSQYETAYDSTVRYIDDQIHRIISTLKNNGLWDETILIVTADHGEALHDRGVYGHASLGEEFVHGEKRHYMYDELLRVPLLVRTPGERSQRISTPFSLGWLHEVVQEITNTDMREFPYVSGRSSPFADESVETPIIADTITQAGHTVMVRNEETKFIQFRSPNNTDTGIGYRTYSDKGERVELDLDEVPSEQKRVARELFCSPSDLKPVQGDISEGVDELLKQLGYKA